MAPVREAPPRPRIVASAKPATAKRRPVSKSANDPPLIVSPARDVIALALSASSADSATQTVSDTGAIVTAARVVEPYDMREHPMGYTGNPIAWCTRRLDDGKQVDGYKIFIGDCEPDATDQLIYGWLENEFRLASEDPEPMRFISDINVRGGAESGAMKALSHAIFCRITIMFAAIHFL